MLTFDDPVIRKKLGAMPIVSRVVFAACCARRLSPGYRVLPDDTQRWLEGCLAEVWAAALRGRWEPEWANDRSEACIALIEKEMASSSPTFFCVDDSVAALAYAYRTMETGSTADPAEGAERLHTCIDTYLSDVLGVEDEDALLSHPLVQTEFARIYRDLDALRKAGRDTARVYGELWERAGQEMLTFLIPAG